MAENRDGTCTAYQTVVWREEILAIAGLFQAGDTRESWLARAARKADITHRHIKAIFYGEMKDPKYSVAYKILSAAQKARVDAAKLDASALSSKFETIAGGMLNADKDFYSADVAALINAARLLRGMDSA
jgi:hypothetical protein